MIEILDALRVIAIDAVVLIAGAAALVVVLRVGRAVLDALPLSRAQRRLIARVRPIAGLLLVLAYAVFVARWLAQTESRATLVGLTLIAVGVAAASWTALRDVVEGIYVRVGQTFAVGDRIEVGAIRGRIRSIGYRAITIEDAAGELAIVPYRAIATQPIRRMPERDRAGFHVFRVAVPAACTVAEARRIVREAALLCHWSAIAHPPSVAATDDGGLEVTVFPVDPDQAPEIERALRSALGGGGGNGSLLS